MNHNMNERKNLREVSRTHMSAGSSGRPFPADGSPGQLAQIAANLTRGGGLADLHCPKAQREARRRFRKAELEHVTQVAIAEIRSVAQVQAQQIELRAAQQRAELVTAENASLGQLGREQQKLAALEMAAVIDGNTRRQQRIGAADLLPEDRELLERMNRLRSQQRVKEIAREHGVRFVDDTLPTTSAAGYDGEPVYDNEDAD
jgi:hypothetical protein